MSKLQSNRGISRLTALLLIAILILLCALAVPVYRAYKDRADRMTCSMALNNAQDYIDECYLTEGSVTAVRALALADECRNERETLCPAGGECYVVTRSGGRSPYAVVCGLHEEDAKLRTRLNASRALERLEAAVAQARAYRRDDPAQVELTLNGAALTALLTEEETGLTRGTLSTPGYDGTVIYYMLDESGVSYFSFADEQHCANWRRGGGWTGDSRG